MKSYGKYHRNGKVYYRNYGHTIDGGYYKWQAIVLKFLGV